MFRISAELNTECPDDCPSMKGASLATEGTDGDYEVTTKTLTYDPNVVTLPVSITIHDDTEEEMREYFCLSVADPNVQGSVYYTRIFIPWNDSKGIKIVLFYTALF